MSYFKNNRVIRYNYLVKNKTKNNSLMIRYIVDKWYYKLKWDDKLNVRYIFDWMNIKNKNIWK